MLGLNLVWFELWLRAT